MRKKPQGPDPPIVDLSPAAMSRAVRQVVYNSWVTLGPLGVGVLAGAWAFLIEPSLLALLIAGGGVAASAANAVANGFILRDRHVGRYLERMNERLAAQRIEKVEALQQSLIECGNRVKGVEELVEQASVQCAQVLERISRVRDVLAEKLSPSELTNARFAGTAEQLSLAILDNLERVQHILLSLPRDHETTKRRLAELGRVKKLTPEQEGVRDAFTERKEVYDRQLERVAALLGQNETALTNLDAAVATLAELDTKRGEADVDLKSALREMEEITRRLKAFSASQAAEGKDSVL